MVRVEGWRLAAARRSSEDGRAKRRRRRGRVLFGDGIWCLCI